jgi:hypothetical protein
MPLLAAVPAAEAIAVLVVATLAADVVALVLVAAGVVVTALLAAAVLALVVVLADTLVGVGTTVGMGALLVITGANELVAADVATVVLTEPPQAESSRVNEVVALSSNHCFRWTGCWPLESNLKLVSSILAQATHRHERSEQYGGIELKPTLYAPELRTSVRLMWRMAHLKQI